MFSPRPRTSSLISSSQPAPSPAVRSHRSSTHLAPSRIHTHFTNLRHTSSTPRLTTPAPNGLHVIPELQCRRCCRPELESHCPSCVFWSYTAPVVSTSPISGRKVAGSATAEDEASASATSSPAPHTPTASDMKSAAPASTVSSSHRVSIDSTTSASVKPLKQSFLNRTRLLLTRDKPKKYDSLASHQLEATMEASLAALKLWNEEKERGRLLRAELEKSEREKAEMREEMRRYHEETERWRGLVEGVRGLVGEGHGREGTEGREGG